MKLNPFSRSDETCNDLCAYAYVCPWMCVCAFICMCVCESASMCLYLIVLCVHASER